MRAKEEGRGFRETGRRACEGLRSARDGGRKKSVRGIEEREGWREEGERAREEK